MRGDCGLDRDATVGVIGVRSSLSAGDSGEPLTEHRVSEGLRQWRDKAGLTEEALGYSLRLYDTRGTAATRLLNHGLILKEIAQHMGWSLRTAANMIEKYARVSADETDAILHKLTAAQRTGTRTEV
jgi:integrase